MKARIVRDGICHEFEGSLCEVILCKLGLHDWDYWHMSVPFIQGSPEEANVCRSCDRCGWMEVTSDGKAWHGRV